MINITFPDGKIKQFNKGINGLEVAKSISSSFAKKAIFAYVNDEVYDLVRPINIDSKIKFETDISNPISIDLVNHTTAHIFAYALTKLYPKVSIVIGPSIENGFHYDFDLVDQEFSTKDFSKIESQMKKIISGGYKLEYSELTYAQAKSKFSKNKYKLSIIEKIYKENKKATFTTYKINDFEDLCKGPHLTSVSQVKAFKLLSLGGSYFKGDKKNKMINRVYGTAWFNNEQLEKYLKILEERKERDHRLLGKQLEIFTFNELVGKGFPIYLPNGKFIKDQISSFITSKEKEYGFIHVETPSIGSKSLYTTSGHYKHYKENMFPIMKVDNEQLLLRPMSCPHHCLVFDSKIRSYKDLPVRISEEVFQYRYEASGALLGLERVRAMELTDSHIFTQSNQIKKEIENTYKLITEVLNRFKIDIDYIELALHDPKNKSKYHNDKNLWNQTEKILEDILKDLKISYVKKTGEAAFYGPKIDIQVRTALGHIITLSTIQLDFLLPTKFNLSYIDSDGSKKTPIMIHRGLIGTYERFLSILLEQTKGVLPLWIAPKQFVIIPVNNELHEKYARKIFNKLEKLNHRILFDNRNERMSYKIREHQTNKIPYQVIIGDEEVKSGKISVRKYGEQKTNILEISEFIKLIKNKLYE